MKLNAIILDDEQHSIDHLLHLLDPYSDTLSVIATYQDTHRAIQGIRSQQPDLLFMDVRLQNGATGFDVLRALDTIDFHVIFTTAFDSYAVQAFRFSALDYLLKPIDDNDFAISMDRFFKARKKNLLEKRVSTLLTNMSSNKLRKISIPTMDGYVFLDIDQIIRCQADINYTTIFTRDNQRYIVARTLKHFEELLFDLGFLRVHNSHLVNLNDVVQYTKGKGGYITLTDRTTVEVSVRKKEELLRALK